jgi:predicted small secreted protein
MTAVLIAAALTASACNTVRGAGQDVTSVANCTEDLMKQGKC